jgi:Zn-dependent protease with chaperone function
MEETTCQAPSRLPRPLPYQSAILDYLKSEEAELWNWFSSNQVRAEHADAVRLDLLKSTYRIEPATQPQLYGVVDGVLDKLGLQIPVTFYQAQSGGGLNAALAFVPGEAHVILVGPVLSTLSVVELKAMLGHELAHFSLFNEANGDLLVAAEILQALSNDPAAHPSHLESARLFGLYTEIFADRGAYAVVEDPLACIATLVKLETGVTEVSAESYLRQADEIFSKSQVRANQLTHPEPFIRARSLKLFAERGESATPEIEQMIQGPLTLNQLDLLGQRKVTALTRRLVDQLLAPSWFMTEAAVAHARLFFDDYSADGRTDMDEALAEEIQSTDTELQDYFCYVVLDFVAVERDLEELPLAAALALTRRLGLDKRFTALAGRELGISKKRWGQIERDVDKILATAREATSQP